MEQIASTRPAAPASEMVDRPAAAVRRRRLSLSTAIVLVALLAGAGLRFYDRDWDEGKMLHPDERFVTVLTGQLKTPDTIGEFFDPSKSTLNPFNTDWGHGYVYGTLPVFVVRWLSERLDAACGPKPAAPTRLVARLLLGSEVIANCRGDHLSRWYSGSVGRTVSALCDLLSVLMLFLLGRRLFGPMVGAIAAAGSAFAVFQIQAAHFYTVDAFTNLLVMIALWFCAGLITRSGFDRGGDDDARAVESTGPAAGWRGGLRRVRHGAARLTSHWSFDAIAAGLVTGLATASKLNAVLLVPVIVASVVVMLLRDHSPGLAPLARAFAALAIAGVACFVAFRVAQPYAFVGPSEDEWRTTVADCGALPADADSFTKLCHYSTLLPPSLRPVFAVSSRWAKQLRGIQAYVSGEAEAPFTHQWANRMAYVFPLQNILFWGLGLPLGIAAIAGFFYMLRQLLRGDRYWAHLIPLLWVAMGFLSFAAVQGKTMRYFLPIYPTLALCAAVGLEALWSDDRRRRATRRRGVAWGKVLTAAVLVLTALWAWAFFAIYRAPVTRVAASRWIFHHVPSAVTMTWDDGAHSVPAAVKKVVLEPGNEATVVLRFQHDDLEGAEAVRSPTFLLAHVDGVATARARLFEESAPTPIGEAAVVFGRGTVSFQMDSALVRPDRAYRLVFDQVSAPVTARTSVIATEHWDDAVPTGIDGKDLLGWYYASLTSSGDGQIQNYAEDEPPKLGWILDWLDEADYISMSSNRLYASIPRLPWRFPMTTEYYRALLEGDLGFELYADFTSFPRLGPFVFNSQELPQQLRYSDATAVRLTGIQVPYPYAEEAFSVYDHPRVLLYRKTAAYSRQHALEILGKYDLSRVIRQRPIDAVNSPRGLLFDDSTREAQRAGGTWSDLFPPSSPLNRSQLLAWVAWTALLFALGLAAFPILFTVLRRDGEPLLADGGWAVARILGLLLTAWSAWLLASVKLAAWSASTLWALYLLLAAGGAILALRRRAELLSFLRRRWWLVLSSELVFLIAFVVWTGVRAANPDLWHPGMGGEKPMDFAYLNGVLRSTWFPAIDPWFAGGYINYYYFGFVLVAAPIKALGIAPQVAYNLVVPMLFALTASAAFGIGATARRILADRGPADDPLPRRAILFAGLASAVFVVLLGNLGEILVIYPALRQLGGGAGFVAAIKGLFHWIGGAALPIRPEWPYWNPTRLTPAVSIAEFPQFTFLYSDLHAHMIGMPIALLAFAFAIALAGGALRWPALLLAALTVGAIWPTNTWDYPIYLLLCLGAIALQAISATDRGWRRFTGAPLVMGAFALLTRVLYIPYFAHFGNAYGKIERWKGDVTPLWAYLVIWTTFLLPLAAVLIDERGAAVRALLGRARERGLRHAGPAAYVAAAAAGAAALAIGVLVGQHVVVAVIAVPFMIAALAAACARGSGERRLLWLAVAGALALTLGVELFVLAGDLARMNTQFKAYLQVWLLLGTMAGPLLGIAIERLNARARRARVPLPQVPAEANDLSRAATSSPRGARLLRLGFLLSMVVAVAGAALYPLFAIPAKIRDRYVPEAPRGLDGAAYMPLATRQETGDDRTAPEMRLEYDYDTIEWLERNLHGTPVVLEGTTGGYQYRWGNRISIYTGLPTVVGWEWHQRQQRAAFNDRVVFDRNADVKEIYSTTDPERALTLMRRYDVEYLVLGQLERAYYDPAGLPKFDWLESVGWLRRVHENPGTVVYQVMPEARPNADRGAPVAGAAAAGSP